MKFIHTADLHLNVTLKHASFKDAKAHEKRLFELRNAFYRLIGHAEENDVDAFFVVGDIFEDESIKMHEIRALFERLGALKAEVFLLIGNHDTFLHDELYQSLLSANNIRTFTAENPAHVLGDTVVYGINTQDFTLEHLNHLGDNLDTEKNNILLLHGDVTNRKDDHFLCDVKTLEKTAFDYIALGHIHKHAFLRDNIAYSGNLEPLDFSETDEKGFIEGTIRNKRLTTTFVPHQSRAFKVHKVDIKEKDTFDDLIGKIDHAVPLKEKKNDFVRIIFKGYRNEALEIDTVKIKTLLEDDFFYVEIKDETTLALSMEALKKNYKDTVIESLIEEYEQQKQKTKDDEESLMLAITALLETEVSSS